MINKSTWKINSWRNWIPSFSQPFPSALSTSRTLPLTTCSVLLCTWQTNIKFLLCSHCMLFIIKWVLPCPYCGINGWQKIWNIRSAIHSDKETMGTFEWRASEFKYSEPVLSKLLPILGAAAVYEESCDPNCSSTQLPGPGMTQDNSDETKPSISPVEKLSCHIKIIFSCQTITERGSVSIRRFPRSSLMIMSSWTCRHMKNSLRLSYSWGKNKNNSNIGSSFQIHLSAERDDRFCKVKKGG